MKVYIVFIQTKTFQEIGKVFTDPEKAKECCAWWRNEINDHSVGYSGSVVVEREVEE